MATVNYSAGYLAALAAGFAWLSRFMVRCGLGVKYSDPLEKVDRVLSKVVQLAWENKEKIHLVIHGVLALQKRFRISGALL